MSTKSFADTLAWFKEHEKPETVLFVADDEDRLKLAVAWTNVSIATPHDTEVPGEGTEAERWESLWANVSFSRDELLTKSATHEGLFEKRLRTLIGNRVLYPDGTLNSFVHRYIREKVLKLFDSAPKKRAKNAGSS